ncbi:hypothetical protein F7734_18085 [Scytonema sp. UIC 10036]|uniref:hypothetical protein n=1 Tax=Scytonema sp. UIC 10036 TaxID=2304196 RepID=UPI0012DAC963|nr:hypothetical protein [Scytonema sp. UIC 10036]MUG94192.1 hypothetical protein [Scytonema sp. UIC 10036]
MNLFSYVKNADSLVIRELTTWIEKIQEYVDLFYSGNFEVTRNTKFGDGIAKVREIRQRAIVEPLVFRGVRDINGILQAGAIITEEIGNIYQYEEGYGYLYLGTITNAPWNLIEIPQPEGRKGAATSLMEEIVRESIELEYNGIIKTQSLVRAKPFY